MSFIALGLLIVVMTIVVSISCCCTGAWERYDNQEYNRERERIRREQEAAALAAKADQEIRAKILDILFADDDDEEEDEDQQGKKSEDGKSSSSSCKDGSNSNNSQGPQSVTGSLSLRRTNSIKQDDRKCAICLESFHCHAANTSSSRHMTTAAVAATTELSASIRSIQSGNFLHKDGAVIQGHKCKHQYHRRCIFSWLMRTSQCPECRQAMWTEEQYQAAKRQVLGEDSNEPNNNDNNNENLDDNTTNNNNTNAPTPDASTSATGSSALPFVSGAEENV